MALKDKRHSVIETIWIIVFQIIGVIMFIAPLYLPIRAYFFESKENVPLTLTEVAITCVGIFLALGGSAVGIVINNIGVIISDFLKRISNTK